MKTDWPVLEGPILLFNNPSMYLFYYLLYQTISNYLLLLYRTQIFLDLALTAI